MPTMRCALIALVCMLTLPQRAAEARVTTLEMAKGLPLVASTVVDMDKQRSEDLWDYQAALSARLLLDQGRVAVTGPAAVHDALLLAAAHVALSSREAPLPEHAPMARVEATYTIHAIGHAYTHRPRLRAEVLELLERAQGSRAPSLLKDFISSAEGLEALGRRWFPEALHRAIEAGHDTPRLHLLRGLWLEREDRLEQSSDALSKALSDKATVAGTIDLVRVLARSGQVDASASLARRLSAKAPGATGTLAAVILAAADERATAQFRTRKRSRSPAERLKQAQRFARQDQVEEAEGLIHPLVADHLELPGVFDAAAGLYLRWRRLGRLHQLLERAEALEAPPERLKEAWVAAHVAAHLAGSQGATAHGLMTRDVRPELEALARSKESHLRRFSTHASLVLAAMKREDEALVKASERALRLENSVETIELIATLWLSQGQMERAMSTLERAQVHMAPSKRGSLALSLASLEIALGAGRRESALLRRGLNRLRAMESTPPAQSARRIYLQALGGRISAWFGSSAPSAGGPGASDEQALRALLPLVDQIDPTEPLGAVLASAVTLSAGALGFSLGTPDLALSAFRIARRLRLSPFMEGLILGQVALSSHDVQGATVALERAIASAGTSSERYLAHKWRALAANRAGDLLGAQRHFKVLLELWGRAHAPLIKENREPQVLVWGGVEIAALMPPEGHTQIQAVLTATPVLAADFPHEKARIETLMGTGKGAKPSPRPLRRGKGQ